MGVAHRIKENTEQAQCDSVVVCLPMNLEGAVRFLIRAHGWVTGLIPSGVCRMQLINYY